MSDQTPAPGDPLAGIAAKQNTLVDELFRRASEGCEGPVDEPCYRTGEDLPLSMWCDPCRCQEAGKALAAALREAVVPPPASQLALKLIQQRIAEHKEKLRGWQEPDGYLIPTEPDPDERRSIRALLAAAIHELSFAEGTLLPASPASAQGESDAP